MWDYAATFLDLRRFLPEIAVFVSRCSKWLKRSKNDVLRFLHFYPLISSFQALSCDQDDTAHFSLSSGINNSQFDFIWLGIDPFFDRFSIDFRSIFDRCSIDVR